VLWLSRRRQSLIIGLPTGEYIEVTVLAVRAGRVRLVMDTPEIYGIFQERLDGFWKTALKKPAPVFPQDAGWSLGGGVTPQATHRRAVTSSYVTSDLGEIG